MHDERPRLHRRNLHPQPHAVAKTQLHRRAQCARPGTFPNRSSQLIPDHDPISSTRLVVVAPAPAAHRPVAWAQGYVWPPSNSRARKPLARWRAKPVAVLGSWLPLLPLLALGLFVVALARPQFGRATHGGQRKRHRHDARDRRFRLHAVARLQGQRASPWDRVGVVKSVVSKFIDERPNDRLGLVEFAGAPYLVSPLTLDHDWLQQNLETGQSRVGMEDGTAIGSAIAMVREPAAQRAFQIQGRRPADRRREQPGQGCRRSWPPKPPRRLASKYTPSERACGARLQCPSRISSATRSWSW